MQQPSNVGQSTFGVLAVVDKIIERQKDAVETV